MKVPCTHFLASLLLAACTVGPDFLKPDLTGGGDWKETRATAGAPLPDDWWKLYNDRELNRLVKRALDANNDLAAAKARVDTSRALVGLDRARMFPRLDLSGSAGYARRSQEATVGNLPTGFAGFDIDLTDTNYRGSFDLAYDLDLWGRNRRSLEASTADAAAAAALYDAQRLGIATEVARQYFLLRGLDAQEVVLLDTIKSRQETLELQQNKADAGLIDGLSTSQARTELELARNDLAQVERQRGAAEHALAVLCGARPSDFDLPAGKMTSTLPKILAGTPAEVLNRRPDVRAAEEELRAANARIGVAQAAFYPNFSLGGNAGYESLGAENFLDWENRILSIGANVAAPIFDAGSNRAAFDAAVSRRDEALARYRNTLLVALREVEDSITDLKGLARSRAALEKALGSARDTQRISQERYDKGLSSYLEVVEAGRTVLRVQLVLAQIDSQQRITLAALAKALGGGWQGK
ncbi:MAG TPA: efflux transporter outer membrane subunit [Luteolibacter sp.]|nr:efflux transporter outer membrane subunit [Luteolibacter sp.]